MADDAVALQLPPMILDQFLILVEHNIAGERQYSITFKRERISTPEGAPLPVPIEEKVMLPLQVCELLEATKIAMESHVAAIQMAGRRSGLVRP